MMGRGWVGVKSKQINMYFIIGDNEGYLININIIINIDNFTHSTENFINKILMLIPKIRVA